MGTETHFPIGTILTRRDPQNDSRDELRVVGGGKKLVVTSNTEFGESFEMDSAVVRREYDSDVESNELYASRPQYIEAGPSPEQVFADMARAAEKETPRRGRGRRSTGENEEEE